MAKYKKRPVEEEEPLPGQHNCANCGMSYEDCFKKVVANKYLPAAEQPCCINCLYMFTHSGKPEMAEPDPGGCNNCNGSQIIEDFDGYRYCNCTIGDKK